MNPLVVVADIERAFAFDTGQIIDANGFGFLMIGHGYHLGEANQRCGEIRVMRH